MTFGQLGMRFPSLGGFVEAIKTRLSREGLHYRFSKTAAVFLERCLGFVLKQEIQQKTEIETELLQPYSRVLIYDSSGWDVNPKLKEVFPGYGGVSSSAHCKIQVGYEYKKGTINCCKVCAGTDADRAFSKQILQYVQSKDLLLVDTGYFSLFLLNEVQSKQAFFISPYFSDTSLFDQDTGERIQLAEVLGYLSENTYHADIVLGSECKSQIKCRLVCYRLPPEVANQRRRKARKNAKSRGRLPKQATLILCDWLLIITNIPASLLPTEKVYSLYRIRWQIELLFKQFKSVLQVHKSNTSNEHRFRCELYGKLIVAVLIYRTHGFLNSGVWTIEQKEISMDKFWKRIQERAFTIMQLLIKSVNQALQYFFNEIDIFNKNCFKLKQRSRLLSLEKLQLPSCRIFKSLNNNISNNVSSVKTLNRIIPLQKEFVLTKVFFS